MVEHVYRRTAMSDAVDETYVATPDEEIRTEVESFGGDVIMTGTHTRATDRVAEAARETDAEVIVVMQGDEPLVSPEMLDAAVEPFENDPEVDCVNLAGKIENEADFHDPNNVKVVADGDGNALYFSREPVPNLHDTAFEEATVYKQVCVIPFRRAALFEFAAMEETPLEQAESIDMLRLLERGRDVKMVETDHSVYAVDTPEDHDHVDDLMAEDPLFETYRS